MSIRVKYRVSMWRMEVWQLRGSVQILRNAWRQDVGLHSFSKLINIYHKDSMAIN